MSISTAASVSTASGEAVAEPDRLRHERGERIRSDPGVDRDLQRQWRQDGQGSGEQAQEEDPGDVAPVLSGLPEQPQDQRQVAVGLTMPTARRASAWEPGGASWVEGAAPRASGAVRGGVLPHDRLQPLLSVSD